MKKAVVAVHCLHCRVCSNNCVKVKSIKLNNFDHGKATTEKAREENAFGRNNS